MKRHEMGLRVDFSLLFLPLLCHCAVCSIRSWNFKRCLNLWLACLEDWLQGGLRLLNQFLVVVIERILRVSVLVINVVRSTNARIHLSVLHFVICLSFGDFRVFEVVTVELKPLRESVIIFGVSARHLIEIMI